ncbi:hypothetical protein KPATCC21470_7644 [Kitasatospora purpeofusca]
MKRALLLDLYGVLPLLVGIGRQEDNSKRS